MDTLWFLLAAIALYVAFKERGRLGKLEEQLQSLSGKLESLEAEVARLRDPNVAPPSPDIVARGHVEETQASPAAPESAPDLAPAFEPPSGPQVAAAPTPPARVNLEERLGTRWAVWVGGVALALGGLLLVRYSIEQGIIGPGVRIVLGALFALALIAVGEWFRLTERGLPVAALPTAHVPGILTAAGTVTAFGTVYAAHALYGFVGPAGAFILLGLIGVATMLAAALHGPALAGVGLAGSLLAPVLVSTASPSPWPLVGYLAAVAAAAYGLARLRRWLWLAVSVVAGVIIWGLVLLAESDGSVDLTSALFLHTILQLTLAAIFLAIQPHLARADDTAMPDWIGTAALASLSVLAILALFPARLDAAWSLFVVAALTTLAITAWVSAPVAGAAALAGGIALGAIAAWPGLSDPPDSRLLAPEVAGVLRLPDSVSSFLAFAALSALTIAGTATARLWHGRLLPAQTAGLYLLAATATPLLALVLAYLRVTQFDRSISFAFFAVLLGAIFAAAAYSFRHPGSGAATPATRFAVGSFAADVAAAMTLAFVMVLDRGYLTVAFALTALTTAIVAVAERLPLLRYVVVALGLIVLGRLAWDPRIMGSALGTTPIFNWLLLGYGAPAVAFLRAGHVLKREIDDLAVRICDALGVLFAALLVFFEIRHGLSGGNPLASASGHVEQGLFALMGLGLAYVLLRSDLGRSNPVFRGASLAFSILSACLVVFGLGLLHNPLLVDEPVLGTPIFSSLLLAYLLPAAAAVVLARASRGVRPVWYVTGIVLLAILLLFGYVTLEVRHAFQGERIIADRGVLAPEVWAYSVAWLALGLIFLAYGIWRGSREARFASAALVMLSVAKVFLYDMSGITGLWRALSFICLGAVLIAIGAVYQKLVFARPAATPSE